MNENKVKAMNMLKADVFDALSKEIIHVEGEKAMKAFNIELARILPFHSKSQSHRKNPFYKSRENALEGLKEDSPYFRRLAIYDSAMSKQKLNAPLFYIEKRGLFKNFLYSFLLLLAAPVYLVAWLLHAPAYFAVKFFLGKYIKDEQFHSSLKLVGMMLLFPLFALIFAILLFFSSPLSLAINAGVLIVIPLSILVVREMRLPYRYALTFWRMTWLKLFKKDLFNYLLEIEGEVLKSIDNYENRFRNQQFKQAG
jgi:hypothetical protein